MAITGRSLGDAASHFKNHLNAVLARTITPVPLSLIVVDKKSLAMLSFRRDGSPAGVALNSRFGQLRLWVGQTCGATEAGEKSHRLFTDAYRYTITFGDSPEPLLRWEYSRTRGNGVGLWCRHHLQGAIDLKLGDTAVPLNDWHLPTGYVPLEEVVRFCIVDLGADPLTPDWNDVLDESYRRFKTEFTSA